jgi:tetraacyldisaccharide 4'-kinase
MDHYSYSDSDLQKLLKMAQNKGAKLVTTKKDWVKFSQEFKEKIAFLDIKLQFSDKKMVKELLKTVITTK